MLVSDECRTVTPLWSGCSHGSLSEGFQWQPEGADHVGGLVFHVNRSCLRVMFGDVLGYEILLLVSGVGSVTTSFASLGGEGNGRSWQQTERQ